MRRNYGDRSLSLASPFYPWAASHPGFRPTSLAESRELGARVLPSAGGLNPQVFHDRKRGVLSPRGRHFTFAWQNYLQFSS